MDQDERRNALLAVLLTTLIVLGWNFLLDSFGTNLSRIKVADEVSSTKLSKKIIKDSVDVPETDRGGSRLYFENRRLTGSILLKGVIFDDLFLKNYYTDTSDVSSLVNLLSSENKSNLYWISFGWKSSEENLLIPNRSTEWNISNQGDRILSPQNPVKLIWKNKQGIIFEQNLSLDDDCMFTVEQVVHNESDRPFAIQSHGILSRTIPVTSNYTILHEGPLGIMNRKLHEITYSDLNKSGREIKTVGGWFGVTDKYWLTAIIPNQFCLSIVNFFRNNSPEKSLDQACINFSGTTETVNQGKAFESTYHFFVGAKVLEKLDGYERKFSIPHFDRAVDFGWFYFITKPMFYSLNWFKNLLGNFGLAILMLTVILKLVFFPLSTKSYRSMSRMRLLQPEIKNIQELYRNDRLRINQEIISLYKREKVNPMAGCLPMLVQIPVFFALYKVLFISIEMRQASFFGWIHDLSQPDQTSFLNFFGLLSWNPPEFLTIGAWPVMMGVSMFLQNKISPPSIDPNQIKLLKVMPFIFTVFLARFPSGLVIYWTWSNILSIVQQWVLLKDERKKMKSLKKVL